MNYKLFLCVMLFNLIHVVVQKKSQVIAGKHVNIKLNCINSIVTQISNKKYRGY